MMDRQFQSVTAARGERVEVLWSNRPLDEGRLVLAIGGDR